MRKAFSLLEMMLVLALLVVVAGLAMLPLRVAMEGQKLRSAADQVRAEWAKSRNLAMKSGRLYLFRYKLGMDEYEIRPWYAADDALESSTLNYSLELGGQPQPAFADPAMGANAAAPYSSESAFSRSKKLPEGISFAFGETGVDTRAASIDTEIVSQGVDGWSLPILFYPDGSSSDARLSLTNKRQQFVSLDLRGLTGLANVSELQSQEEASQ